MKCKRFVFGVLVIFTMCSCTIKATTDTTTDGTTEFVSSTSGKIWSTEEGLVKQGGHAGAFVWVNYDNLIQDIARGEGEYLCAFQKILNIPTLYQKAFANRLQHYYEDLSGMKSTQGDVKVEQFLNHVVLVTTDPSLLPL